MARQNKIWQITMALLGVVIYAVGVKFFVVPLGLYNGGILGFAQVIRTVLADTFHITTSFDLAGVIYYLVNIPIFILAFRRLRRELIWRTLLCITVMTVLLSVIPSPTLPPTGTDKLAGCLLGGLIVGFGMGLTFQMGGTGGGLDLVGLMMIQKSPEMSVGRVSLSVNVVLYALCCVLFNVRVALYSIIVSMVSSFTVDRVHYQNINVEVHIITKDLNREMKEAIMAALTRGITVITATGAYTGDGVEVLYILVSKYEVPQLKHIVHEYDPSAFIIVNEGVRVSGHYEKHI